MTAEQRVPVPLPPMSGTGNSTQNNNVPVPEPHVSGTRNTVEYGDVAALLSGDLPPAPTPDVLARTDGVGLFYSGQVNMLFGDPETGKTFVALGGIVEAVNDGLRAVFLDLDHNGMQAIVSRLVTMGADQDALGDLNIFRYKEPEDGLDLTQTVRDLQDWQPDVVVVDSIGELLPMYGLNSNSPDDFTQAHTRVLKPLAMSGAAVIAIDHLAKNPESKAQGPTGTVAKTRAAGGAMLRVTSKEKFTPDKGGSSYLNITKDRHGGLRAESPTGDGEPLAGTFRLHPDGQYKIYPATGDEQSAPIAPEEDVDRLNKLTPPPENVRDVKNRMQWGSTRASRAFKAWKKQPPEPMFPVPETQGSGTGTQENCELHGVDYFTGCYTCDRITSNSRSSFRDVPEEQGTSLKETA